MLYSKAIKANDQWQPFPIAVGVDREERQYEQEMVIPIEVISDMIFTQIKIQ
jgi:hypothetical protein